MNFKIRPFQQEDTEKLVEYLVKHLPDAGFKGLPFSPYSERDPLNKEEFIKGIQKRSSLSTSELAWQKIWLVVADDQIFGSVDLRGNPLHAFEHRCLLGMGLDPQARGQGLGKQMLKTAIDWARQQPQLEWIDLEVFSHNLPARKLYQSFGFQEIGTVVDRFRVRGQSIDDVRMALRLK